MLGYSTQKYGYSHASVKTHTRMSAEAIMGLKFGESKTLPCGCPLPPDVTVCGFGTSSGESLIGCVQ
jgi:hypothetical protein